MNNWVHKNAVTVKIKNSIKMKDLKELTRPNIWALKPYSSARDEYNGAEASVFWMPMRTRTIHLITVILILCSGN